MNKFFVIAVFMVTLCQCQVIDPFAEISRLKNAVNSVSNDLKNFTNNSISDATKNFTDLNINQIRLVTAIAKNALDEIQNDIAAAKKQLKDADHCLEPMRLQLFDISMNASTKSNKCLEYQLASLNSTKDIIDVHIESREPLLDDLDGIASICIYAGWIQVQPFLALKIPAARASVSDYEITAKQLQSTIDPFLETASIFLERCHQQTELDTYSAISKAKISSNECIRNS